MIGYLFDKESIKISILVFLIALSIVQMTVLLGSEYGFAPELGKEVSEANAIKSSYFKPYRVIINKGDNSGVWSLSNDFKEYESLWLDTQNYISAIFDNSSLKFEKMPDNTWWEQISKEVLICDFNVELDQNTVRWFLDKQSGSGDLDGIQKIAISPWDESVKSNDKRMCAYVMNSSGIYRVLVPIGENMKSKKEYLKIINDVKKDEKMEKYYFAKDLYGGAEDLFPIREDVLITSSDKKSYKEIRALKASIPQFTTDMDKLEKMLLGKDKDEYMKVKSTNGDKIIFSNVDSQYTVSKDGVLNYAYKGRDYERASEYLCLEKALEFIKNKLYLGEDVGLYLSGVAKKQSSYEFTFDYKASFKDGEGNIPISADYSYGDNLDIKNAIKIEANNKKVWKCKWLMREFTVEQKPTRYINSFESLTQKMDGTIRQMKINDIQVVYKLRSSSNARLDPFWFVIDKAGKEYFYDLEKY